MLHKTLSKAPGDVIIRLSPLSILIKPFWNKRTELISVQSDIFIGCITSVLFLIYMEFCMSDLGDS